MARRGAVKSRSKAKKRPRAAAPLDRSEAPAAEPARPAVHAPNPSEKAKEADDAAGSYFFPHIPWSQVTRLQVFRVKAHPQGTGKGRPPQLALIANLKLQRWSDEQFIADQAGGGDYTVRATGPRGTPLDHVSFPIEGEPREVALGGLGFGPTAHETAGGVVTIPGVDPVVNLLFAQQQQISAMAQTYSTHTITIIADMFKSLVAGNAAVASAGNGGAGNAQIEGLLKILVLRAMGGEDSGRAEVQKLREELHKATRKDKRANIQEMIGTSLEQLVKNAPDIIKSIGELVNEARGLPAGGADSLPSGNDPPAEAEAAE